MTHKIKTIVSIIIGVMAVNSTNYSYASTSNNTHETTLDNGLKIIVKEDHRAPVIISEIWYKVGASYEHNGITGISHMLEHMMFKATKNLKDGEFTELIARKGGQQNAFTSNDYTGYYQLLSKEHLDTSFYLEAERMQNLLLDPAILAKELQVVTEERRMRTEDDPISNTEERLAAAAHISSPYHHPVIGWPDDIKNYQVTDLRPWYETWYAPNNAIITVVGDVNPEDVFASAKKYFGYIKAKTVPNVKPRTEMKPLGERNIIVNLPAKLPYLFMAYNVPSFKTATNKQDVYALEIISSILTSGNSARLNKRLIREQELVTSVNTSYNGFSLYDDLFSLMAIPTAKKTIADVKAELLKQLNDLKTNLVATQELDRVKAILIANKIYEQDNISYQATTLGMLESINLSWRDYDLYLESLKQVTPEQIKATANQYFTIDRLTTAVLQPQEITLG